MHGHVPRTVCQNRAVQCLQQPLQYGKLSTVQGTQHQEHWQTTLDGATCAALRERKCRRDLSFLCPRVVVPLFNGKMLWRTRRYFIDIYEYCTGTVNLPRTNVPFITLQCILQIMASWQRSERILPNPIQSIKIWRCWDTSHLFDWWQCHCFQQISSIWGIMFSTIGEMSSGYCIIAARLISGMGHIPAKFRAHLGLALQVPTLQLHPL